MKLTIHRELPDGVGFELELRSTSTAAHSTFSDNEAAIRALLQLVADDIAAEVGFVLDEVRHERD